MLNILKELYEVQSPSGFEGEMAKKITEIAQRSGLDCRTDALGNLIIHRRGTGKRVLLDAHMDTTGFLAMYIDEKGFIRFDALGGLLPSDISCASVEFLNGTKGAILYEQKEKAEKRKISSMFIDIGAGNEEEARKCVLPGDAATYAGGISELANGRIKAPYLDNRIGCAVALYAITNLDRCEYDVYAVFSAQEEVGCRGAKTAAFAVEPDFAIVLDVTDSCETPGFDGYGEVKLGGGAAIKVMDKMAVAHPAITSAIASCAEENKIPYQRDIITIGGTDAGSIHLTKSGVPTGGISVPVRYMHSPCEVADMADAKACAELLIKILETKKIEL